VRFMNRTYSSYPNKLMDFVFGGVGYAQFSAIIPATSSLSGMH
jgi:hypothetical protein